MIGGLVTVPAIVVAFAEGVGFGLAIGLGEPFDHVVAEALGETVGEGAELDTAATGVAFGPGDDLCWMDGSTAKATATNATRTTTTATTRNVCLRRLARA